MEIFGIRKLESLGYHREALLRHPTFSLFSRTPTCDSDRQTDTRLRHTALAWRRAVKKNELINSIHSVAERASKAGFNQIGV